MGSKRATPTDEEVAAADPLADELRLTARRDAFCREYVIDLNATQAAIRAGYSEDSAGTEGHRLLQNANVITKVRKLQADAARVAGLTAENVLSGLLEIRDRCMQVEQVYDRDGNPLGIYQFDSKGANAASVALGKHLALFADRKIIEGIDGLADRINRAHSRVAEGQQAARLPRKRGENV